MVLHPLLFCNISCMNFRNIFVRAKSVITEARETYSSAYIAKVLRENKVIASVGMSLDPKKPSYLVGRWLSLRGFTIIPVNPVYAGQEMWGKTTYSDLHDIQEHVDMVQIFRRSEAVSAIVEAALEHLPNLKTIWMQLGVQHPETAAKARANGLEVVQDLCPKMELQRISGELGRYGVNTGFVTSRLLPLI